MRVETTLTELAIRVGQHLTQTGRRLVTAESCTGGWVAKALTDVAGSSGWYLGGVVTYSNELKTRLLNVSEATLLDHGAVSEATVRAMAEGALQYLGGDIAVAISGIAGPGGGMPDKPVGTVWLAWVWRQEQITRCAAEVVQLPGDREQVRRESVLLALKGVLTR